MFVELKNKEDLRILKMCNNPVGNYEYFLCIEDINDCSNYIAIGFRNCQIIDTELKDIRDTNFFSNCFRKRNISNICVDFSNGFSHDSDLLMFLGDFVEDNIADKKLMIFEIKDFGDMFDGTYKHKKDYSEIVTRVWSTNKVFSNDWKISGFDAMTFEVFLKRMSIRVRDVQLEYMNDEEINNKIRKIISKIY